MLYYHLKTFVLLAIGKLYLIPTTLGETEPLEVMPLSVKKVIEEIDYYIVENEKSARRFIKKIAPKKPQPSLQLMLLDKYAEEIETTKYMDKQWCQFCLKLSLKNRAL